ncbi:S41 family peptidase [Actomonas aquatica]|uniref:S41 family peptidase n=1 Tax=Actomonas aquatica TaxID=2866162 RepID=A0ABZ1C8M5_9BACT|nr:S41 family peptidase [Opitutus sp. WL0086]WRQ86670.1 S41 family peptidase [Opitutus sp. WL0086]
MTSTECLRRGGRAWASWWGTAVLVLAVVLSGGCVAPMAGPPEEVVYASAEEKAQAQVEILEEAWELVNDRFYDPAYNGADWPSALHRYVEAAATAEDTAALYDVINDMLDELEDAHTVAMSPAEAWEDYVAERAFVGVNLERVEDRWVVSELRPGSSAEEVGVEVGWIAVARDGEVLTEDGITFTSEPGERYVWTFLDALDVEREVVLEARTLSDRMPPVERRSAEGWVYLRFDEFERDYDAWLQERLMVHRDAPGVVLDLRSNSGGDVSSLERVINQFFDERKAYGAFVSRKGKRRDEKSAWRSGADYGGEVVILIGPGSASSAEILAATMQHYGRATLIGRPTAGVVVASQYHRLRDGGQLQLGTYDFQTLDGTRLEGNGVHPDVDVERTLVDLREGRDPDLGRAVEWLRAKTALARSNL